MIGTFRFPHDDEAHYTPTADVLPGEIVQLPDGRAAINNSFDTIVANSTGVVRTDGLVELVAPSALVLAAGAAVFNNADAIAAAGGYKIGALRRGAKINGQTVIYVALNK